MKQLLRFSSLMICLLFVNLINAQVVKGAEGAVKRAEEKVFTKAVEKTFNGIVDKLFGSDSTSTSTTNSTVDSTGTEKPSGGGLFGTKTVDKAFVFDLSLDMEITTIDKKGKESVINSVAHYPKSGAYIGSETESVLNIMDFEEMKNYAIIGGKVTIVNLQRLIDKANKLSKKNEEDEEVKDAPEMKKTGRKEIIAGFECEEFLIEDDDIKGSYWLTEEIGISAQTVANAFSVNPSVSIPNNAQGMVLKMEIEDKKNKTTTVVLTTKVSKDQKSYDLSKYKATDLSRLKF